MSKYKTKEEALKAVKLDGRNLYEVDYDLKDDEEVVTTALKHGGLISHASARLQNAPSFILEEARHRDGFDFDFDRALFCAKRDFSLCEKFNVLYKTADEFQIELKLVYGQKYISPIRKYNFLTESELIKALEEYRKKQVSIAREIYVQGYDADYIEEHEDLYLFGGHSALQWGAVSLREQGLPFSEIINHYPSRISYEKQIIDDYCSGGLRGSYPERVMTSLLKVLDVDFAREQTFPWSTNVKDEAGNISSKRYDFYIPTLSTIIEVHGAQHYEGGFEYLGGRSLAEEQANDKQKCELAKANGIQHYIVINALSSTLEFIKESIVKNEEFNHLFNVANIDWKTVHDGTVVKIKTDVEFPLFEEMEKRCNEWVSVIEKELIPSDFTPLESTKKELQMDETPELKENIKNSIPSKRGLYPHELAVLKDAPGYHYPLNNQYVPGKWFYDYGIGNLEMYFKKLVDKGFLQVGDVKSSIEHSTVPVIKRILTEHNLPTKGRKAELIELLLSNVSLDELDKCFTERYYQLTELGEQELADNEYVSCKNTCGLSVWTLNRIAHAFPNDSIDNMLLEYSKNPRRFLKYLSEDERDVLGITYTEKATESETVEIPYSLELSNAQILDKSGQSQEALEQYVHILFINLTNNIIEIDNVDDLSYYFPYEKSLLKVAPGILKSVQRLIAQLSLSQNEVRETLEKVSLRHQKRKNKIFTLQECIEIITAELNSDHKVLGEIYRNAEIRSKKGFGQQVHSDEKTNKETSRTESQVIKPTPVNKTPPPKNPEKIIYHAVEIEPKKEVVIPTPPKPVQTTKTPVNTVQQEKVKKDIPVRKEKATKKPKKVVEPTIKNFFKNTKVVSRVLTGFALFFAFFANFSEESRLLTIIDFMVVFFLPALITELCSNPVANGSNLRVFKVLTSTKVVSRILFYMWAFTGLLGAGGIPSNFYFTIPIMGIIFLLPAIIIEIKTNPHIRK